MSEKIWKSEAGRERLQTVTQAWHLRREGEERRCAEEEHWTAVQLSESEPAQWRGPRAVIAYEEANMGQKGSDLWPLLNSVTGWLRVACGDCDLDLHTMANPQCTAARGYQLITFLIVGSLFKRNLKLNPYKTKVNFSSIAPLPPCPQICFPFEWSHLCLWYQHCSISQDR